jgi:hypothetical protein
VFKFKNVQFLKIYSDFKNSKNWKMFRFLKNLQFLKISNFKNAKKEKKTKKRRKIKKKRKKKGNWAGPYARPGACSTWQGPIMVVYRRSHHLGLGDAGARGKRKEKKSLWASLRRKAVIDFPNPNTSPCCRNYSLLPPPPALSPPPPSSSGGGKMVKKCKKSKSKRVTL